MFPRSGWAWEGEKEEKEEKEDFGIVKRKGPLFSTLKEGGREGREGEIRRAARSAIKRGPYFYPGPNLEKERERRAPSIFSIPRQGRTKTGFIAVILNFARNQKGEEQKKRKWRSYVPLKRREIVPYYHVLQSGKEKKGASAGHHLFCHHLEKKKGRLQSPSPPRKKKKKKRGKGGDSTTTVPFFSARRREPSFLLPS